MATPKASNEAAARNAEAGETRSRRARLRLLGAVELDGELRWHFLPERRFRLLAYLALQGGWVPRDQLANLFWPERTQDAARSNFRKLLMEVRSLGIPGLEDSRHALRWQVQHDVAEFSRAHAQGDHGAVLALYQGQPLCGLDGGDSPAFAAWLRNERLRLRMMWRHSVFATMDHAAPAAVIEHCRRLLEDDPYDEEAVRAQMRALAALGRTAESQRVYKAFAGRIATDLAVDASIETKTLARAIEFGQSKPGRESGASPAAGASEGFIGRAAEMAELQALLADSQCRMITVTGPGGMGKSRLVKEVIRRLETQADEPVCWVALDDLTDIAQVAPRVAVELRIELSPLQDPVETVATHLASLVALLVFDNCEHLQGFGNLVERWLGAAPQLRILATSRSRIAVGGEWLVTLHGLEVPTVDTGDDVLRSDAARLFVTQAQLAHPRFNPVESALQVAGLVRAVGGMPLAILLAASWVRLLPVSDMVSDLAHLLDVLEQADDGNERPEHRSMRATLEQSWRLLSPVEQRLLAVLSVFGGSFARAAVHEVSGAPLPVLGSLIDKSLVQLDRDARYSLHPLIRQFSAEKLSADRGAEALARAAHVRCYDQWLRRVTDVPRADEPKANAMIEVELENLRLMWRHAVAAMSCDALAAAAVPMMRFFELRSRWLEGEQLLGEALDALTVHKGDDHAAKSARANVWRALATLDFRAGQRDRCIERAERSLRLCRELSIRKGIKGNLNNLGLAHWQLGRLAEANGYFAQAVEEARADGDTEGEAIFLANSALVAKAQGHYQAALSMTDAALSVHRARDNSVSILTTLNNLGNLYRALQQPRQAIVVLTEALARADQNARLSTRIFVLCNLALAHADLGEFEQALAHARASEALQSTGGEPGLETSIRQVLARALAGSGRFEEAREHLARALRLSLAERRRGVAAGTLMYWGRLVADQGDSLRAARILAFAATSSEIDGPDRDVATRELALVEKRLGPQQVEQARRDAADLTLEVLAAQLLGESVLVSPGEEHPESASQSGRGTEPTRG